MDDRHDGALALPARLLDDPQAKELVRIWSSEEKQVYVICAELWEDPGVVGLMLVDLARHTALAYAQKQGRDPEEVLERIKWGFDAEWHHPTDEPETLSS